MSPLNSVPIRRLAAVLPLLGLLSYGLLVSSPRGEAARSEALRVAPDERLELAGVVGRLAQDSAPVWPGAPEFQAGTRRLEGAATHPAVERVRRWVRHGFTTELLAALLMQRGPLPGLAATGAPAEPARLGSLPGAREFDPKAAGYTPAGLDSLATELEDFQRVTQFPELMAAAAPALERRTTEIETDPTLRNIVARLADFLGESPVGRPTLAPTLFGAWRGPFAFHGPGEGQVTVVDRAPGFGRLTPETSLSWVCAREFARPVITRLGVDNRERVGRLSGYWDYFKQGVAATTTTGWEDCLNAHLFRAIDLRVRAQDDAVERELRVSAALDAGLGMIRAVDGAMGGYDRSRSFYRRFADYYPTLIDNLTGLEARRRVERPRLGIKASPVGTGLRINTIVAGSTAATSGLLKVGDILVSAQGVPLRALDDLVAQVQSRSFGTSIQLEIERGGVRQSIAFPLSSGRVEYEFDRPEHEAGTPAAGGAGR